MTDTNSASDHETRSLVIERTVPAPPDEVWNALTTPEGLTRWFPLEAEVDPRVGGIVALSWGPGAEGKAPIHVWEPGARFGWTESHGEDEAGRPIEMAVDFYLEGRDGSTVVRLVQSGFSATADWDDMYDALKDGWTYFLFNLAYYFLKHRGKERTMVWRRVATDLAREAVWERLVGGSLVAVAAGGGRVDVVLDRVRPAEIESVRAGHHFAATLPDLDDSVLFVEVEGKHVGFWLSTYGVGEARVKELRTALDARIEEALNVG